MEFPVIVVMVVPRRLSEHESAETLTYEEMLMLMRIGSVALEGVPVLVGDLLAHEDILDELFAPKERFVRYTDTIQLGMGSDLVGRPSQDIVIPQDKGWGHRPPRAPIPKSQVRGHMLPRSRRP